jgi:hypothetical protein
MARFWVSWWSSFHVERGCTEASFETWITGYRGWNEEWQGSEEICFCATFDAPSCRHVWREVKKYFPDFEERFCTRKPDGWEPPEDRFPVEERA